MASSCHVKDTKYDIILLLHVSVCFDKCQARKEKRLFDN